MVFFQPVTTTVASAAKEEKESVGDGLQQIKDTPTRLSRKPNQVCFSMEKNQGEGEHATESSVTKKKKMIQISS